MKILVVSPHPDDETLGAGGTLLKYRKRGHQLYWLNVTDMSTVYGWDEKIIAHRQEQIQAVKRFYGFSGFYNLAFPPSKLSEMDEGEIISAVKRVFEEVEPEWLILPGQYDAHSDHRIVYNCCMACAKTFRTPYIKRIMTMEIISETDYGFQGEKFSPNFFVDISGELEDKLEVMRIYDTEIEKIPFPRSLENIRALAVFRGGICASRYAEAFCIVKQIE